jgi:hypothetical protein
MARAKAKTVSEPAPMPVVNNGRSEKVDSFLKERIDPRYYLFWEQFIAQFPLPFDKPSSSSGKYHLNTAGTVDSLEEHTLDLLRFVDKLVSVFGDTKEEQHYDLLLLAAGLHDVNKYGNMNERRHTTKEHGVITANLVKERGIDFGLNDYEIETLYGLIAMHDGRWSTANPNTGYKPITFTQLQLFLHVADMASSRRILKFD